MCPTCDGIGKYRQFLSCNHTKKQNCKPCPDCGAKRNGDYIQIDTGKDIPCGCIDGKVMETKFDYIKWDMVVKNIPFSVSNKTESQSFNQAFLGKGYVLSVTDYNRNRKLSNEELIELIKNDRYNDFLQALNIVNGDNRIANEILITRNNNGYSGIAVF